MELKPTEPPGHARRKLRGLVSEISRLQAEGYTVRAIHRAIKDAGITVGLSTVQRELERLAQPSPAVTTAKQPAALPALLSGAVPASKPAPPAAPAPAAPQASETRKIQSWS